MAIFFKINVRSHELIRIFSLLIFVSILIIPFADGRIYTDPTYDFEYLTEECFPYNVESGEDWNDRVKNLTDGISRLYGYVQAIGDAHHKDPVMNCAIKVVAPPGYKLVVRIPRVEIYHDDTGCEHDYMSVIGATDELSYCGFGTVTHSIYSTSDWLIFRILASESDEHYSHIGFLLYYTAVRAGECDDEGDNATEWRCRKMDWCTPSDVVCDTRDNCGLWEDELTSVCGLTDGAIVGISVVCVLVGGSIILITGYFIYNKHKEKKDRERRQREIMPTLTVGYNSNGNQVNILPAYNGSDSLAEPPPPYTFITYVNQACTDETNNTAAAGNQHSAPVDPVTPSNEVASRGSTGVRSRPAIGEPPPVYTPQTGDVVNSAAVSFDPLPEKTDS